MMAGSRMAGDARVNKFAGETVKELETAQQLIGENLPGVSQAISYSRIYGVDPFTKQATSDNEKTWEIAGLLLGAGVFGAAMDKFGDIFRHADDLAEVAKDASKLENAADDVVRAAKPVFVAQKLTPKQKDLLRSQARSIWVKLTGGKAIDSGLRIHHRIPLEWAHVFPDADPNRLANLVGVSKDAHTLINKAWATWKQALNGRLPSQAEVMRKALEIDTTFGQFYNYPK